MFEEKYINRFWSKIKIKGPNECWLWLYGKDKGGYGEFSYKGRTCRSHVFSFMITNDIILKGTDIIVRHTCNNKICCNPNHLIEGNHYDNMQDSIKAGTAHCINQNGIKNSNAKLTKEEVKKIRQLGYYFAATSIAKMPEWKNKISETSIRNIITYKSYKDID